MEEEENEDSLIVEENFEDSTKFELASLLTDSSSMNSEIISATAEDLSEIVSGTKETVCSSLDTAC